MSASELHAPEGTYQRLAGYPEGILGRSTSKRFVRVITEPSESDLGDIKGDIPEGLLLVKVRISEASFKKGFTDRRHTLFIAPNGDVVSFQSNRIVVDSGKVEHIELENPPLEEVLKEIQEAEKRQKFLRPRKAS